MEVCPTDAIVRTEFDTVYIQQDVCNGCRDCISACPYGAIALDGTLGSAQKCDWCADRRGRGERTACEATCPTSAIRVGSSDEPDIVAELARGSYAAWEPEPTAPRVRYRGLTPEIAASLRRIDDL